MPRQSSSTEGEIVKFLRKRDYSFQRELGNGACGRTVLLYDDLIDEQFVCKKYSPFSEDHREELFKNFVREIKLLHKIQHENLVRVFNYYLYPDQFTGYILMEFIEGIDIEDYISQNPENTNSLFLQAINGFKYLEEQSILHRDIRPLNILIRSDGILKIIDLGFGKQIRNSDDFDKSISLNWWCETPADFAYSRYDFTTEVYFIGKLFEKLISDNSISHFKYASVLRRMCQHDPTKRIPTFADIEKEIRNDQFAEFDFSRSELEAYRKFANELCSFLLKMESSVKYSEDIGRIVRQLEIQYRTFMLESYVPDPTTVVRCFLNGTYFYKRNQTLSVNCIYDFLRLFKTSTEEKRRLILANLHTRFDTIPRYAEVQDNDDDIPF
jgi:serine/threonine-protein kinase